VALVNQPEHSAPDLLQSSHRSFLGGRTTLKSRELIYHHHRKGLTVNVDSVLITSLIRRQLVSVRPHHSAFATYSLDPP
jgi:hypothetical protein